MCTPSPTPTSRVSLSSLVLALTPTEFELDYARWAEQDKFCAEPEPELNFSAPAFKALPRKYAHTNTLGDQFNGQSNAAVQWMKKLARLARVDAEVAKIERRAQLADLREARRGYVLPSVPATAPPFVLLVELELAHEWSFDAPLLSGCEERPEGWVDPLPLAGADVEEEEAARMGTPDLEADDAEWDSGSEEDFGLSAEELLEHWDLIERKPRLAQASRAAKRGEALAMGVWGTLVGLARDARDSI